MSIEEKLDSLEKQLKNVVELLQLSINALNTKKSVAQFLNKSEKTIENYIKNGTFQENKHYFINENSRVEFLPIAIVEFKKKPSHKVIEEEKVVEEKVQLSETTSSILKGIV